MATVDIEDIENKIESYHYVDVCEEEIDNLNNSIDEALAAINQSILAVRRLIVVRNVMRDSDYNE